MKGNGSRRKGPTIEVDNVRGYPANLVEELRGPLEQTGVRRLEADHRVGSGEIVVRADPRCNGFYELEADGRAFYVAVSPTGKTLLLATWPREPAPELGNEESLVERVAP